MTYGEWIDWLDTGRRQKEMQDSLEEIGGEAAEQLMKVSIGVFHHKIFYAHCRSIYGTPQEARDLETIRRCWPGCEIINPADEKWEAGYNVKGMDMSLHLMEDCDIVVFRGVPGNGITAGIYREITEFADALDLPVLQLPSMLDADMCRLNVPQTRQYLKEVGQR